MTERGLKNINVFYSTFTNVFFLNFCHIFYVFNVFLFLIFLERFLHLWKRRACTQKQKQKSAPMRPSSDIVKCDVMGVSQIILLKELHFATTINAVRPTSKIKTGPCKVSG